jgi:hypothetical protein
LEHCDNALTYRVLNPSTLKVIHRSSIRPIRPGTTKDLNLCAESLGGDIVDHHDFNDDATNIHTTNNNPHSPSIIDMEEFIGRYFIVRDVKRIIQFYCIEEKIGFLKFVF